jgi:GDP-D-mannose dehydratase
MYLMLQQEEADDFVVATGETHTVREFCRWRFAEVGLSYQEHVRIDERFCDRRRWTYWSAMRRRRGRCWGGRRDTVSGDDQEMVETDMKLAQAKRAPRQFGRWRAQRAAGRRA